MYRNIESLCCIRKEKKKKVAQSCLTLCYPMDCSLPGFSIHGILQARILEWVTISFSRGSSWLRDSRIGGRRFNLWATREARALKILVLRLFLQRFLLHHFSKLPCRFKVELDMRITTSQHLWQVKAFIDECHSIPSPLQRGAWVPKTQPAFLPMLTGPG